MNHLIRKMLNVSQVSPERVIALMGKFPDRVEVQIRKSEDGGYWVEVNNLPGCLTQADSGKELFELVNDAIRTYLGVPEEYSIYMPTFFPTEEVRKRIGMEIPREYLEKEIAFQRI